MRRRKPEKLSETVRLNARVRTGWALALPLLPALLFAQAPPGSVEVGVGAGRFIGGTLARGSNEVFDRKVDVDQDPIGGFWLSAQLTPAWGVELAYRRTPTQVLEYHGGVFGHEPRLAGLDVASLEVLAVRSFRRGNFLPYVGAGVGVTNLDIDTPDPGFRDTNRAAVAVTGGARFFFTPHLGIRIDLRGRSTYLGRRRFGEDHGWTDTGRWFADTEVTGGVFLSVGGH